MFVFEMIAHVCEETAGERERERERKKEMKYEV